ncbi:hypothetical protein BpHYR1_048379 [Brachionus plicatilis]|uniref:Uncharacterized protein n=1 Tax=Brachionus plicatilis TaxID=10195 RepID=A0A3M7QEV9_BRAPC|nr:hypothetical protein BpHYR1_048379 [Brachionus plicatilis]
MNRIFIKGKIEWKEMLILTAYHKNFIGTLRKPLQLLIKWKWLIVSLLIESSSLSSETDSAKYIQK